MNALFTIAFLLISLASFSQQKISATEYQTKNGEVVKVGDTLTLRVGSRATGTFNYIKTKNQTHGIGRLSKKHKGEKIVVIAIAGEKSVFDKAEIHCKFLRKKWPLINVEADAAFILGEVYLPGKK